MVQALSKVAAFQQQIVNISANFARKTQETEQLIVSEKKRATRYKEKCDELRRRIATAEQGSHETEKGVTEVGQVAKKC